MKILAFSAVLALNAVSATAAPSASVYDEKADARAALETAVRRADAEGKRVLVDFGANWCGDCLALDRILRSPENQAALASGYVVVHVDIGRFDKNADLAARFGIPLKKGVPALAVVDGRGALVYAQKNGEFEAMRKLDPRLVRAFLDKWKPAAPKSAAAKGA
jgi:thiol:disulfide interchange protein